MEFKQTVSHLKESPMRDILHKTTAILQGRGKAIRLREHAEDKECITDVRKNFIYIAYQSDGEETPCVPQVHIQKSFDSLSRNEKFIFRVKGFFFVNRNRRPLKIGYCHTLRITLHWKIKSGSSKKSVTMA